MAEFKRAFGSADPGTGLIDSLGLDGTTLTALGDASAVYWPLLLGAVLLVLLIIRGDGKAVIPVAGGMMLLQAWQSGLFH